MLAGLHSCDKFTFMIPPPSEIGNKPKKVWNYLGKPTYGVHTIQRENQSNVVQK